MQVMNFSSANCKNCYKCVRTCTIKAIEVLNDQAKIRENQCIACGHCLVACPQNARHVLSDMDKVKAAISNNQKVVVQLAPSFRGVFQYPDRFVTALRNLGFSQIEEVSIGAELVSEQYEDIINESNAHEFITSCCPSVVLLIEKYYPELLSLLLPIDSPMVAHGKTIKQRYNDAFAVFIGPCISKKCEALEVNNEGIINAVLTFDEIAQFMKDQHIDYTLLEESQVDYSGTNRGDRYPVVGGILNAIRPTIDKRNLDLIRVHGLDNCRAILQELKDKAISNVCIELSACNESCLGGPGIHTDTESIYVRLQRIQNYLKSSKDSKATLSVDKNSINLKRSFSNKRVSLAIPSDEELNSILRQMGKYSKEQELNCGACGYNTCREKSVAVFNGMSQVEMCVPYMRSLAESMNIEIFKNSPNAIIIIDNKLNIKEINPSGRKMLFNDENINVLGTPITQYINDNDFLKVLETGNDILREKIFYSDLNFHGYKSIIHLKNHSSLLVTFTDITDEENRKLELAELKSRALDVTQSIINKQMRVAQEIASLLGETTAETKVAILDLKNVLEKEK